jgi:hypothetical protein
MLNPTRSARLPACAAAMTLALTLGAAPVVDAATPAGAAKPAGAAMHNMTGTWNRYPQIDEKPNPKFPPPPPPVGPPPLKPQYLADWQAQQKAAKDADARGQPLFTDYVKCLPDGMPAMMLGMFPMEVLQTPGQVTIIQEAYNQVRRIYLNEKQIPLEDAEPGYWGHSVGHWEGNTLIVDTVGIKPTVKFRGVPHGDKMRIREKIVLVLPNFLEDHVTVEDTDYLTGPWEFTWAYTRLPKYKMNEYVCDSNREYKDPETGGTRLHIGK